MKHINYNENAKQQELSENRKVVDEANAVELMTKTDGWKIVEHNLREQLQAYITDNSTNAKDWSDYQQKAGKIFGIQLLLVDIEDYIRQGEDAAKRIDDLNNL